jgi:hypothetical protein
MQFFMQFFHRFPKHSFSKLHLPVTLLIIVGLVSGMLAAATSTARAEPNAPELTSTRPAPAVQLYTVGVQIAPLLPELLGVSEPKSYLLLLQNNHELRATGGFITAVGRVTFDKGRVTELVIDDSYNIVRHDVDHPYAPEAVRRYMQIELLFLRDANWSPDFPTSARLAASLYAQDAGVKVDGVISADLNAVKLLVDALAPLEVEGSDVVLTGANVLEEMMLFWDRPLTSEVARDVETESVVDREDWLLKRKDFIPLIAESINERLQSGNFDPLRLINATTTALNERAIQIWLDDPDAAEALAQQRWDGALVPERGADYVALVETNMGYNKVNAVLERSLAHRVSWPDGPLAPAQAEVTVTYRHPIQTVDEMCEPRTDFSDVASYTELTERCYFGYVRLFVPGGSDLVSLAGVQADSIVAQPGERGTTVFGGYFSMKPGEEHTLIFTYQLPPQITLDNYRLIVQRQAGMNPLPLEIMVDDTSFALTLIDGQFHWPAAKHAEIAAPR